MMAAFAREGGYGIPASVIRSDSSHPNHIIVPDAQLLFTAQFHRAGPDLILISQDGRHHIIPGYFASEHRPALAAPNGASLTPDLVDLLAGSPTANEYAQAGAPAAPTPVGTVEKVVGSVAVMRNGVAVALHVGDKVYQSDVIQTGSDSQVGISFPDGTALNLTANTRMAINEFSYDEHAASGNGALLSLVEGSFSFVAGKVAHTGDMKIDTPVAIMGIRGTTGWVMEQVATVSATAGNVTVTFAIVPDFGTNRVGAYDLIDRNGNVVATVSEAGLAATLTGNGVNQPPSVSFAQLSPAQAQFQQNVIPAIGEVIQHAIQNNNQPNNNNNNNNPTPQSTPGSHSDGTLPQDVPNNQTQPPLVSNPTTTTVVVNTPTGTQTVDITLAPTPPTPPAPTPPPPTPTPTGPITDTWSPLSGNPASPPTWNTPQNWNAGTPPAPIDNAQVNSPVPATITDVESVQNLTVALGATVAVVSNTGATASSLTVSNSADDAGKIQADSTTTDPIVKFDLATVTVESTGTIEAHGNQATVLFSGDTVTVSTSGSIIADDFGGIVFNTATDSNGQIHGDTLDNAGSMTATSGGGMLIQSTLLTNETGAIIEADTGGTVELLSSFVEKNLGTFEAGSDGKFEIVDSTIDNAGGNVEAIGSGALVQLSDSIIEGGTVATGDPSSSAAGEIEILAASGANLSMLDGTTNGPLTLNAYVQVDANANLDLTGTINSTGTVDAIGTVLLSDATIQGGILTSGASGLFEIQNVPNNAPSTFEDVTVSGATIHVDGTLALDGDTISGGTIDALLGPAGSPQPIEIPVLGYNAIGPAVSANGEFVAFIASTSLPGQGGDTAGLIELYNATSGQLTNISALVPEIDLHDGEHFGDVPSISDSGRYVVFQGKYQVTQDNLDGTTTTFPSSDVFLDDSQTQQVTLVRSDTGSAVISGNGQVIAAQGNTTESGGDHILVMNDNGSVQTEIEGDPSYVPPDNNSDNFGNIGSVYDPSLSDNGRFVSFWSTASEIAVTQNGVTTDISTGNTSETVAQVYVYDTLTHTLKEASGTLGGVQGNGDSGALTLGNNNSDWTPALSGNGRFVVFQSTASNLVAGVGDANHDVSNIFLYDTHTGKTVAVTTADGSTVTGSSMRPEISADGKYITFASDASDLPGANGGWQTYMVAIDPATGALGSPELLSTGFAGADNGQNNLANSVSDGGGVAAFGGAALGFNIDVGQATVVSAAAGTVKFAGGAVTDYNPAGDTLTVTVSVAHGTLAPVDTISASSGLSIVGGNNGSHGTLEFSGPLDAVNAALQSGAIYTPTGYNQSSPFPDTMSMTVTNTAGEIATQTTQFDPQASGVVTGATNTGQYDIFLENQQTVDVTGDTTINDHATIDGGLLRVESGVTLTLNDVTDNGSTILNNGTLDFTGPATLQNINLIGGQLTIESDQTLTLGDGETPGEVTFKNVTVTDNGTLQVDANETLTWAGSDSVDGSGVSGDLVFDNNGHVIYAGALASQFSTVTWEGAGTVTRDGGGVSGPSDTLVTNEGNTFDGFGTQGGVGTTLVNEAAGTFDADVAHQTYTLDFSNITNAGTLEATNGGELLVHSTVQNSIEDTESSVVASGGFVDFELGISDGTATISDGGKLEYGWSSNVATTFADASTLQLDHQDQGDAQAYTGTVRGFGSGDVLDLRGFESQSQSNDQFTTSPSYDSDTNTTTLTITDTSQGNETSAPITLSGDYSTATLASENLGWSATSDGSGGVNVTEQPLPNFISFSGGTINTNGNVTPQISPDGSTLTLTDGNASEAASWFATNQVSVAGFTASFDYKATGSEGNLADGMAFILQDSNAGINALGGNGSSLGYGAPNPTGGGTTISPSAAVELNLYNADSPHVPGTNFATDGGFGSYNPTGSVDFADTGDAIQVVLSYNGRALTETLTDLVNGNTYSTTYNNVDLAQILGSTTAYVGFSAATGGGVSTQTVSDFIFGTAAQAHWVGAPGADWTTSGDWSDGNGHVIATPNSTSDVVIDESGNYTLAITSADTANLVTLTAAGADVQDEAGGSLTLAGALSVDAGSFSLIGGSLTAASIYVGSASYFVAEGTVQAPLDNDGGTVQAYGNLSLSGAVTGSGTFEVNGHTLDFGNSIAGGTVDFGADTGTLQLDQSANFHATVNNFTGSDVMDLTDVAYSSGEIASWTQVTSSGGTLQIYNGDTLEETLNLAGTYTTANFSLAQDSGAASPPGSPGTEVLWSAGNTPPPVDTWTGTGDWTDGTHWSTGSAPGAGAQAAIASGGAPGINFNLTFDSLTMQSSGEIDIGVTSGAILTLDDGTTITGGNLVIGDGQSGELKIEANGTNTSGATLDDVSVQNFGTIQVDIGQQPVDLVLSDGTTVSGGTLSIGGSGEVEIAVGSGINGNGATLDGVTVNNQGLLRVDDAATLTVADMVTLQDGGTVSMLNAGSGSNIVGVRGSDNNPAKLDNVDNIIKGPGTIGDGSGDLALTNAGTIDATQGQTTLDTGNTITNKGLLEASSIGSLDVQDGTINWAGTTPTAGSNGIFVAGTLLVDTATLKLTGGGDVSLAAGSQIIEEPGNQLVTSGVALALDNVDNTISGAGTIGNHDDLLALTNEANGTIDANVSRATLTIDTADDQGHSSTLANAGTLKAENGGELSVHSIVDNTNGTVVVSGAGSFVDFLLGISGGSATIADGGKLEYGWSSDVATAFTGPGTLQLDHQNQEDPQVVSAAAQQLSLPYGGTVTDFGTGDTIDLTDLAYATNETVTWTQGVGSGTLAITSGGQTADIALAGTYSQGNFALSKDNGSGTDVVFNDFSWGELNYPAVVQGEHLFGVNPQFDSSAGFIALAYNDATDYSTSDTSFTATPNVESLDPFFLPGRHAPQTLSSFTVQAPGRYNLIVPNIDYSAGNSPDGVAGVFATGIYVFKGKVDSTNGIWQVIATPDGNGGVTPGAPTEIGDASTTGETIYNLKETSHSSGGIASSYSISWDQFGGSSTTTGSYNIEIQLININGSAGSPANVFTPTAVLTVPIAASGLAETALPAWDLRPAANAYVLAVAESSETGTDNVIHFQGYKINTGGTAVVTDSVSFTLQPDLNAYAGATNEIVQPVIATISQYPGQVAEALQFAQSPDNGNDYFVAWNETVNSSTGAFLGDQVEFAVLNPINSTTVTVELQNTFQIADGQAQNVRVGEFTDPFNSSQDDVVVAYGDDTGTHINEYAVTATGTAVTLLASFTDPTTQAFDNMTVMGDGRIAITYNDLVNPAPDETSQYDFKIFDLRAAGITIDDSNLNDGENKYIAGTHFTDTFTGENNVNNLYYFVGEDTTSGPGPTDTFTGGSNGWNIAVFADARSDYSFATDGSVVSAIANNGADAAHIGSLDVTNVQFLAFDPASDPTPHNNTIDVNGGTFVVLQGNIPGSSNAVPISIEAGATAEIDTAAPYSGSVTFEAATGTLGIDQPNDFHGTIANITTSGDILDLGGFNAATDSISATTGFGSFSSGDTTLTVDDATDSQSVQLTLVGDYSESGWTVTSDGHGGADVFDPPITNSPTDPVVDSSATATGVNGTVTFTDSDATGTEPASFTPDGSNYLGSFSLGQVTDSNGAASVEFDFNDDQNNLTSGQTLTQSYNVAVAGAQNPADNANQTVSVTVGGPGNDNFVFAPGVGADTVTSFNAQQDTLALDHFANVQTVQELQALISTDIHGDAVINLGHNDSVTLAGVTDTQLQQVIHAGHVLLH